MHIILACFLTVFGTLWTQSDGLTLQAVNMTRGTAHVTAIRAKVISPSKIDDGEVPDPSNFTVLTIPVKPALVVKPGARVSIPYSIGGLSPDLLYDADAVCEDAV